MRPADADPELLSRAARRCALLAGELAALERALERSAVARWSGSAAVAYGGLAGVHREGVAALRQVVEKLGMTVGGFARELADEQVRVHHDSGVPAARTSSDDSRIVLLHKRFRRDLTDFESECARLRARLCTDPPRWTGPVRPPDSWVRPPARRVIAVAVPDSTDAAGRARLPWRPPWVDGPVPTAPAAGVTS